MRMSRISILFLAIVFLSSLFPIGGEVHAAVNFSATELLGRPTD